MHITIEIGTPEQKKLIENEVRLVFNAASNSNQNLSINKIIVPVDFDSTVNTLQGTTSYQSVRNLDEHDIVVNAKVIHNPNGSYLVISPHIFSEWNDAQTRCFIYMHELVHVVRKHENMFSGAFSIYEHNLETFIEEYIADRIAYGFVDQAFQTKSDQWQAELSRQSSQIALLLANPSYPAAIKSSIKELQIHQDIMRFLQEIHPVFDGVFISLAHAFSLSDSYPSILPFYKLEKSKFVDERTIALVEYARERFQKKDHDLNTGISLVSNFMRNFGIAFEDSPNGLICHVDYSDF